ncbi:MAG: methylated-DNA--[protein]-cysteine S-methyltransferase [Paracoccaceae bacterium]
MYSGTLQTPLGTISVTETDGRITSLDWRANTVEPSPLTDEALRQLQAYFDCRLATFDLPLDFGTGFNEQVRRAMLAIPQGETRTYGELARTLGTPAQAIGQACGANPIPIIIPCHRILGAHSLGGFSAKGGVETKVWLLKHEGAASLLL